METETKLPFGAGSIQLKGRVWWLIYRSAQNKVVQENSDTEDQATALRLLAKRALKTLAARQAVLYEIAKGGEETTPAHPPRPASKGEGAGTRGARTVKGSGKGSLGRPGGVHQVGPKGAGKDKKA